MVLRETLGHLQGWDIRVLATDIDTNVLSFARRGLYSAERLEKMDGERVLRWFERAPERGQFSVRDEVKRMVTFNVHNLVGDWPMSGPFDIIFCRNVIIYFDRETQRRIVEHMAQLQRPGDHLIIGHSESLLNVSDQYRLVMTTVYARDP
jgi:chemotaxis protein methyltransferase CheR